MKKQNDKGTMSGINPSPSNDPYFDNPQNIKHILESCEQACNGEIAITLKSKKDLKKLRFMWKKQFASAINAGHEPDNDVFEGIENEFDKKDWTELNSSQKAELEKRYKDYQDNPEPYRSWNEIKKEIKKRL